MIRTRFISILILGTLLLSACSAPLTSVSSIAAGTLRSAADTLAQQDNIQQADKAAPVQQTTPEPVNVPSNAGEVMAAYQGVLENIYAQVAPSVVSIRVLTPVSGVSSSDQGGLPFNLPGFPGFGGGQESPELPSTPQYGEGAGSGFVWDTAGHIVTNNHVVEGAEKIEVTFSDGTTVEAKVVALDPDSDLAVLKVDASADLLKPVTLADSQHVRVGQLAIAIGNPYGLENTMTVGIISALGRTLPVGSETTISGSNYSMSDVIQTDAPINPGNSGGVLVDDQGHLLGVTFAIESTVRANSGIGYVIPSAIVERVVPSLIDNGSYQHTYLGISAGTLTPTLAEAMNLDQDQRGVLVSEVVAGGPADKAGLRGSDQQTEIDGQQAPVGGDVITAIDGQPLKSMDELISYLANNTSVGQTVTLSILRDGKAQDVKATLQARPSQTTPVEEARRFQSPENPQDPQSPQAPQTSGAWLGINAVTVNEVVANALNLDPSQTGVLVTEVASNGPADQGGLRGGSKTVEIQGQQLVIGGDVVIAIDGDQVATLDDLVSWLDTAKPNQEVTLTILRDGRQMDLTITLGERPA